MPPSFDKCTPFEQWVIRLFMTFMIGVIFIGFLFSGVCYLKFPIILVRILGIFILLWVLSLIVLFVYVILWAIVEKPSGLVFSFLLVFIAFLFGESFGLAQCRGENNSFLAFIREGIWSLFKALLILK